jgi:hypothetical protein
MSGVVGPRFSFPEINLTVWLKGDYGINTGTPIDGDAVYQWQDQSGNGNHFVQATAIRQPEYKASLINGLPGVFVDGTTFLELLSQVIFSVDEGSVWIVAQQTVTPPNFINGGAFWSSTDGSFPPFMTLHSERVSVWGNNIVFYDGYQGKTQVLIPEDNLPHYIGLNKSATDIDYYADSSTVFANKAHVEDWTVYVEHFLGDQLGLANATMIGNICEFIVYDKVLSTSEVATVTNYLTNKYGI